MTKILLPVDGSPRSARTAAMLRQMFSPGDVEVSLVTVIAREIRALMRAVAQKQGKRVNVDIVD